MLAAGDAWQETARANRGWRRAFNAGWKAANVQDAALVERERLRREMEDIQVYRTIAEADSWDRCYPGNVNPEYLVNELVNGLRHLMRLLEPEEPRA